MRSNGVGYGKATYAAGAARIKSMPGITDLVATRHGDLMVVSYRLSVDETINGNRVQAVAPRLTVFRKAGGAWLVVAHANFAQIGK